MRRRAIRRAGAVVLLLAAGALAGLTFVKVNDDRYVASIWQQLERIPPKSEVFWPGMVSNLPEPARRYFLHAIQPGTPLATRAHLRQTGSLRVNADWIPFSAEQLLTPEGFVWRAGAQLGVVPINATDHVADGEGRMRIAALGLVPFVNEGGPEITRSTIGRLVAEYMWLPSALLPRRASDVEVEPVDAERFAATVTVAGETTRLVCTVDSDGRLIEVSFPRFGNLTSDQHYQYIPFGGPVDAEGTFGGYTIPTRIRGGWWYGTEQYEEAFRFHITGASFE
jgi:hypothetical protein